MASIDAVLPLANVRPMSEVVSIATGQPRFTTVVMVFFAGVALFLAGLGFYGILAGSNSAGARSACGWHSPPTARRSSA